MLNVTIVNITIDQFWVHAGARTSSFVASSETVSLSSDSAIFDSSCSREYFAARHFRYTTAEYMQIAASATKYINSQR